jgi:hypothetical protein
MFAVSGITWLTVGLGNFKKQRRLIFRNPKNSIQGHQTSDAKA